MDNKSSIVPCKQSNPILKSTLVAKLISNEQNQLFGGFSVAYAYFNPVSDDSGSNVFQCNSNCKTNNVCSKI